MPRKIDPLTLRRRRVHGWAFRDHTDAEVAGIQIYLSTGDRSHLPERYQPLLTDTTYLMRGERL